MPAVARLDRLATVLGLALLGAGLFASIRTAAQVAPPRPSRESAAALANFDVRASVALRAEALQRLARGSSADTIARFKRATDGIVKLRAERPGVVVRLSPATGGAEVVQLPRGALSPPRAGDGQSIVTGFLQAHASIYGLAPGDVATVQFRGESVSRGSGLRMVRTEQVINGIPVFPSDGRFILDREGRLIRTLGAFASVDSAPAGATPRISAAEALVAAVQSVGITVPPDAISRVVEGTTERLDVASPHVTGTVISKLVYFPLAPGVLALAYQQFIYTDGPGDYLTIVDATSGTLLWRKNARAYQTLPTQAARFSVYVQADGRTPADSPAPHSPTTAVPGAGTQFPGIPRAIVSMAAAQDPVASPAGWLPDGVTTTTGNNVDACLDSLSGVGETNVCDAPALDNNGRPVGNPDGAGNNRDFLGNAVRDFNYAPAPVGGNPNAGDAPTLAPFQRGAVTQLFYTTNWYHDQLFHLGFDEAAGNFQTTNFSGQGIGGDAVRADVQDGSGTNNANFATPPDGIPGRMQMYRFTFPDPDRDAALDADIVIHELTHGTSNRLVGNGAGLIWDVGVSLGEGWSDFYALSLLNATNTDDPDGRYASGGYITYQLGGLQDNYVYGIRRFPYSTDNAVNPLTWADVDDVTADYTGGIPISPLGFEFNGALEVHNAGEVWALTLWEVRSRIIQDPAGANGDVPTGNRTMLQLVTDAMKLTPSQPSFIEARDALIDADCATNACANERWIWEGFADRGLGHGAVAPLSHMGIANLGHIAIGTSFAVPGLESGTVTIDDSLGNNNHAVDPGEPIRMTVALTNPWHNATFGVPGATAVLSTTTPGVTIVDAASSYPAIAAGASATGDTFQFLLDGTAGCGSAIDLTLTVTSALGVTPTTVRIRVGAPSGVGSPVTYTRTVSPGLPIPDGLPRGVFDSMTITDDLEIADLNYRVDNLTHIFSGDVTAMLRAPNGYGGDLIWLRGILLGFGTGDNFVNTVIDDQSSNDLNQSPDSSAPFTGSWLPAFNSPIWNLFGDPSVTPDPVGQLGRLNGTSTRGTWTTHVADSFSLDAGTLHQWSIIVTPTAFSCTAFVDTVAPRTTVTLTPPPDGANGWHRTTPVTAAVSATDAIGGVAETRCALDPPAAPGTFTDLPPSCGFTGPGAPVAGEGLHVLYAASIDGVGNAEVPVAAPIRIDPTPPTVACVIPAPTFGLHQAGAMVTATVSDATSGPAAAIASAPADTTTIGLGTVNVSGLDLAGNATTVACPYNVAATPTLTIRTPTTDPVFAATSPFLALTGDASDDGSVASVSWTNDRGGSGLASGTSAWTIPVVTLQTGANLVTVTATDDEGHTSSRTLTATFDALTYHLAEGSTGSFFAMDLALANPNPVPAPVSVTMLKLDGTTVMQYRTLPPTSHTTLRINDIAGADATTVSATVASLDLLPLGVGRTMSWDATAYGGHGEIAISQPRRSWHFAEGAQGFFHTYIHALNPNAIGTTVTVTFRPEGGTPVVRTVAIGPHSRLVLDGAAVPELQDRAFGFSVEATQPIVAERSMYFGNSPARLFAGGHAAAGMPDPAPAWYFAEGATGSFFDTFILLSNPGAVDAHVTLTYLLDDGTSFTGTRTVPPGTRVTVSIEGEDPRLASAAVSTRVTSDAPIVAERSMYWAGDAFPWAEGHNSGGSTAPGARWLLTDGRVGGPLEHQTYILLANPSTTAANVTVTYLRADGAVVTADHVVPPTSRQNVLANSQAGLQDESFGAVVAVTNGVEIFVEQSMYWNVGGVVWSGGTNASATRLP